MYKKFAVVALTGATVAACSDPITPSGPSRLAPIAEISGNVQSQVVANEYIVVLRTSQVSQTQLTPMAQNIAAAAGAEITYVYGAAVNGFAVRADAAAIAAIRGNTSVDYVEPVQVYRTIATQSPATWGIDRIDQRNLPLSNSYTYPTGGSQIHIYIIDTGIRMTHNEFTGRIGAAADFVGGQTPPGNDCNGHGTHVAGTAGGTTWGVNKNAILHAVRVLNCSGSGTTAGVIAGINHVTGNAVAPAVSNMSLGGGASTTLDNATTAMVNAGVVSAVAAGNSNANACNFSPARASGVITVAATTNTDARASFSNFGTCVEIFAPGQNITSAWNNSNTATNTISGTSMASPHVAGAAALYRSFNPTHTAAQVGTALINNATMGVVTNPGTGSPNRLLYMGFISGGTPNQNPIANFTYNCVARVPGPGFDCAFNGTSSSDPDGSVVAWNWSAPTKPNKTGANVTYVYPTAGTYSVTLTVTDNNGATGTQTQSIVVGGGPPANLPPIADFTRNCVVRPDGFGADCAFSGSPSSDPDGTIVSYAWTATGRANKTGVNVTYPFPVGSTQTVTLTVTDTNGAPNTKSVTFQVP